MEKILEKLKDVKETLGELHDYAIGLTTPCISRKHALSLAILAYIMGIAIGITSAPSIYRYVPSSLLAKILYIGFMLLILSIVFVGIPVAVVDVIIAPLIRILKGEVGEETVLRSIASFEENIIKELEEELEINMQAAQEGLELKDIAK